MDIACEQCGKVVFKNQKSLKRNKHQFCSTVCGNNFYGARCKEDGYGSSKKTIKCLTCQKPVAVNKQCNKSSWYCTTHKIKKRERIHEKICITCNDTFRGTQRTSYCKSCYDQCRSEAGKKGGKISANSQQRRSKNEILFAEELIELLKPTKILCNTPYFPDKHGDLWDADIIIPDLKLAIHWNGSWHYKQISKKISVFMIQNRDKIKYSLVEESGYTNYIIRDDGAYSIDKVKDELNKFASTYIVKI